MFIGHFALGFAAKTRAPRTPLTVLIVAAIFLDVLWPIFLLLGLEHVRIVPAARPFLGFEFLDYPWSHSLLMSIVWSIAVAVVYRAFTSDRSGARWVGLLVFSHWVLDWFTHLPDLPIAPGMAVKVGLRMWEQPALTVFVEVVMFCAGVALYLRATRARSLWGQVSLGSFVALLAFAYYGDVTGPPPPSVQAIVWVAMIANVVTVPWLIWIDRTRRPAS